MPVKSFGKDDPEFKAWWEEKMKTKVGQAWYDAVMRKKEAKKIYQAAEKEERKAWNKFKEAEKGR